VFLGSEDDESVKLYLSDLFILKYASILYPSYFFNFLIIFRNLSFYAEQEPFRYLPSETIFIVYHLALFWKHKERGWRPSYKKL